MEIDVSERSWSSDWIVRWLSGDETWSKLERAVEWDTLNGTYRT